MMTYKIIFVMGEIMQIIGDQLQENNRYLNQRIKY